jgi:hypothetical protein
MTITLFFQCFKLKLSLISHQQAIAEHWDLPNTEIFLSEDVASGICYISLKKIVFQIWICITVYCRCKVSLKRGGMKDPVGRQIL